MSRKKWRTPPGIGREPRQEGRLQKTPQLADDLFRRREDLELAQAGTGWAAAHRANRPRRHDGGFGRAPCRGCEPAQGGGVYPGGRGAGQEFGSSGFAEDGDGVGVSVTWMYFASGEGVLEGLIGVMGAL